MTLVRIAAVMLLALFVDGPTSAQPPSDDPPAPDTPAPAPAPAPAGPPPFYPVGPDPYRYLPYDEDWSFLKDPARRTDFWDPIKYIPLAGRDGWYATVGGLARERFESYHNPLFGGGPANGQGSNSYLLQRYMLHADAHLGENVRLFGQLKSGLEDGRVGGPRPFDKDTADFHQGFIDLVLPGGDAGTFTLRGGRQELAFGSFRLVDVREDPNVRQSFDAIRGIWERDGKRVDVFWSKYVRTRPDAFDDDSNSGKQLWGVYGVTPWAALPDGHADLYYLGSRDRFRVVQRARGSDERHTFGTRLWGRPGAWDYNAEANLQLGRTGGIDAVAGIATVDAGYTWQDAPLKPRAGLTLGYASGDGGPGGRTLGTYNLLYPSGQFFNRANDLPGPVDFVEVHPKLTLNPRKDVLLIVDYNLFWRARLSDGLYDFGGFLFRPSGGSRARYVGGALSAEAQWQATRHLNLTVAYTHLFAGRFLRETGPGKDVDFVAVFSAYRF